MPTPEDAIARLSQVENGELDAHVWRGGPTGKYPGVLLKLDYTPHGEPYNPKEEAVDDLTEFEPIYSGTFSLVDAATLRGMMEGSRER